MKMRNKDTVDFGSLDFITVHLHLRPFTTIYQKKPLKYVKYLSGGVPMITGRGRTTTQYRYFKSHLSISNNHSLRDGLSAIRNRVHVNAYCNIF
jgi:hypothetical protein